MPSEKLVPHRYDPQTQLPQVSWRSPDAPAMPSEQSKVEMLAGELREADAAYERAKADLDTQQNATRMAEERWEKLLRAATQARKALIAAALEPGPELPDAE